VRRAGTSCNLLFVRDSATGRHFLVDSGADVSVFPASAADLRAPATTAPRLTAANGSAIRSCGTRSISLTLGHRRLRWPFIVADVQQPILGADFLRAHAFLVDMPGARLVDATDFSSIQLHRLLPVAAAAEPHRRRL
jgi:hypothetical protein